MRINRERGIYFGICAVMTFMAGGAEAQDAIRGGRLYDRWWAVLGTAAPTGDHPLYPVAGAQTGSTTFRCKECHGWDYKGAGGAYTSGPHFTGIPGVYGSTLTALEMFDVIKNPNGDGTGGTTINGHDFGSIGLSDADLNDLVGFLQTLVVDTNLYIDINGDFVGNATLGETNFTSVGMCIYCHGADGTNINFGTPENPEWVGTVAEINPWEFLHKVRLGQPTGVMPSWTGNGGSDQGAADIGAYVQGNFPTGFPSVPALSNCGLAIMLGFATAAGGVIFRRRH